MTTIFCTCPRRWSTCICTKRKSTQDRTNTCPKMYDRYVHVYIAHENTASIMEKSDIQHKSSVASGCIRNINRCALPQEYPLFRPTPPTSLHPVVSRSPTCPSSYLHDRLDSRALRPPYRSRSGIPAGTAVKKKKR